MMVNLVGMVTLDKQGSQERADSLDYLDSQDFQVQMVNQDKEDRMVFQVSQV